MTVGRELEKISGLKLFHNHMTIEIVLPFFEFGSKPFNKLIGSFRKQLLEEVASSELPGIIFTFAWDLDQEGEKKIVDSLTQTFSDVGPEISYVELEASQKERLIRNHGESRLLEKPSKRNLEWSDNNLKECDSKYMTNTNSENPFYYSKYLKINTEKISAQETALAINDFLS
jgi:hypothetical protein